MLHPAVLPALALVSGAAIGLHLARVPPWALAVGLVLAWLVCLWAYLRRRDRVVVVLAAVAFCLAGILLAANAQQRALHTPLRMEIDRHPELLDATRPVQLEGVLRQDAAATDYGASLDLMVTAILVAGGSRPDSAPSALRRGSPEPWRRRPAAGGWPSTLRPAQGRPEPVEGWRPVTGGVRLAVGGALVPDAIAAWRAGRRVRVPALLREPTVYRNPGGAGADERRRLALEGIAIVGSVKSARLIEPIADGGVLSESAAACRAFVRATVARHVGRRDPRAAAIITAILVGDRAGLTPDVQRRLQEAGTYHVIAISGGNIAILASLLLGLLRLAASPPRVTATLTIASLIGYAVVVGDQASVERATLVAVLYLSARLLDHRTPPLNSLSVAGGLLVALAPLTIVNAGFQLSFGATAALILGVPGIVRWTRQRATVGGWTCPRWLLGVVALFAATLCAELALVPVSAFWFSRVTFAGFVLNFIAIPLMGVAQVAGLVTLACAPISAWAADRAGDVAWLAAAGLVESARAVDLARWLVLRVPAPPLAIIGAYYSGWALWFANTRRPWLRRVALAIVALSGLVILIAPDIPRAAPPRGWLRVTFLDVAQGDATLVQLPGGRSLLVDAGGAPGGRFDLGGRVVMPALWSLGVRRLDVLAITHPDPDHIGGAAAVARDFHPRAIWEGVPVPRDALRQELLSYAAARAIEWRQLQAGDRLTMGGVEIVTLHPPPPDWERQDARNDDSLVLDVRYGDVSIVLPGDIGQDVERALAPHLDPAGVRIFKAPHHGSASSSSAEIIDALRPRLAVISAGTRNFFGHPAPVVLARYRAAGVDVLRTDRDGAITVETDGRTFHVRTWGRATRG